MAKTHITTVIVSLGLSTTAVATSLKTRKLTSGWQEISPGGQTSCARGTPFSFFVYPGATNKIIVDFAGGGACWDRETCDYENPTFEDSVDGMRSILATGDVAGIYNMNDTRNPFYGWTHVIIPYCTGDVHWGDRDVDYERADGSKFTIRHRGATNAKAAIDWVSRNVTKPDETFVTGCSAGSYGSIYWLPSLRRAIPEGRMTHLGDAGAGVMTPAFKRPTFTLWNISAHAPWWVPGLDPREKDYANLELKDFYTQISKYHPGLKVGQFNSAYDIIQTFFYVKMGGHESRWNSEMITSIRDLSSSTPNFRSYVGPGEGHCALTDDELYEKTSLNVKLIDWLKNYTAGYEVPHVYCQDCRGP